MFDVLLAGERPRAAGMCVGHADFVDDLAAVGHGDHHPAAVGLACARRVVAPRPFLVFDGGDLVPQRDGVRARGAFTGVGRLVVPRSVLQGDREDVRQ